MYLLTNNHLSFSNFTSSFWASNSDVVKETEETSDDLQCAQEYFSSVSLFRSAINNTFYLIYIGYKKPQIIFKTRPLNH